MDIVLTPKKVAWILALIIVGLLVVHIVEEIFTFSFGRSFGLSLFDMQKEHTIQTL